MMRRRFIPNSPKLYPDVVVCEINGGRNSKILSLLNAIQRWISSLLQEAPTLGIELEWTLSFLHGKCLLGTLKVACKK